MARFIVSEVTCGASRYTVVFDGLGYSGGDERGCQLRSGPSKKTYGLNGGFARDTQAVAWLRKRQQHLEPGSPACKAKSLPPGAFRDACPTGGLAGGRRRKRKR